MTQEYRPLVEVKHLKQYFPITTGFLKTTMLKAVDDVSFTIGKGETLGLVGESGCGKTTVGRSLLHLYKPTSGEISFDGMKITKKTLDEYHRRAQMVFQDPYSSLNPRMTVGDIVAEPIDVHKLCKTRQERAERVQELLRTVGISGEQSTRYAHEFSGGQRQRIGIARSLAVKPKFVVCDEAVSALDVSIQSQIINLLADLKEQSNLTYLFITHDLSVVKYISDRIGVMYLGNMVELANTQELFDHPLHPYTEALMAAIPTTDVEENRELRILEGDIPSPVNPPQGCKFHTRCAHCTEICKHAVPEWKEMAPGHFVACHHPLSEKE